MNPITTIEWCDDEKFIPKVGTVRRGQFATMPTETALKFVDQKQAKIVVKKKATLKEIEK